MSKAPMIAVHKVTRQFGERTILEDISLFVSEGEILAVIGPSGCGKSTLLRLLSGLDEPDQGTVDLADDNVTLVFQYSALFDSLTVFENVAFALMEKPDQPSRRRKFRHYTSDELVHIVSQKLELVGLDPDIMTLYPSELSGGMQKRVSFARAIVSDPKIILYDEPTAGLDPIAATMIEDYIATLRQKTCATSVVVTHNLSTIRRVADRVCLLFNGKIQWQGTASEFFSTDNPYAVQFASASLTGPMTASV